MNILKIVMNTEFPPIVIDGTSKDPCYIEVFDESGECIYRGYMTKDGLGLRERRRGLRS